MCAREFVYCIYVCVSVCVTLVDCAVSVLSVGRWREWWRGSERHTYLTCTHTYIRTHTNTHIFFFAHTDFKSCPTKKGRRGRKYCYDGVISLHYQCVRHTHTHTCTCTPWGIACMGDKALSRAQRWSSHTICHISNTHTDVHTNTHTWNLICQKIRIKTEWRGDTEHLRDDTNKRPREKKMSKAYWKDGGSRCLTPSLSWSWIL